MTTHAPTNKIVILTEIQVYMRDAEQVVAHVKISPMGAIPYTMQDDAYTAMYGNKTCSLENMNMSCFAAERCAMAGNMSPQFPTRNMFDQATHTLIAHSLRSEHDIKTTDVDQFVGCVCVGPASVYPLSIFPFDVSRAHVIYNLCVSNTFQGGGVGRQLVNAARSRTSGPLYLFVLNTGKDSSNSKIATVMTQRVERLETTYGRMGLQRIANMGSHTLFQVT